jgi:uncharacterized membrane protein
VALMIVGLVLFLGVHLIPMAPRFRALLVARMGDNAYRGAFALVSAAGIVLIVIGYRMAPRDVQLFAASPAARTAAPVLVSLAFVLFAAANMRTHIRYAFGHPMLIGLMLWSGVHLAANGDLAGTILFGSFFIYSIVDLVSAIRRRTVKPFAPVWKHDTIAIVAGLLLAWIVIRFHGLVFGVPAVG